MATQPDPLGVRNSWTMFRALPRASLSTRPKQINIRVTEFIVNAAIREAQEVLDDQLNIFVDGERFAAFERAIDEPLPPKGALKDIFATRPPWGE